MQPKVSIITVNFNGKKFLKNFFDSIRKLKYRNLEVIFFDNGSEDKSVEYVKKKYLEVKVIESKKNLGFSVSNNKAVKKAKGKYLFFLNNDTKVDPNAISELVKRMEKDQKIGICGCKMMSYNGKRRFHTGIGVDIFGYPIVWGKVFYAEGSALMIKKELFKKLEGFDLKYFMFHEDIDLAWRTRLLGYRVIVSSKAIVYHVVGGSAGGRPKFKGQYKSSLLRRYYSERNNIRTLLKNYQTLSLLFIFPFYFLINLTEVFFYLAMFKFKVIYLYLKAYIWNIVNLGDTLKERGKVQKTRKVFDKQLIKNMYFGSGKLFTLRKVGIPDFK